MKKLIVLSSVAVVMIAGLVVAHAQMAKTKAPADAKVYIISPKNGDTVTSPFVVEFGLKGMGVAPAGVTNANTGHHHLLIDVATLPDLDKPLTTTDPDHITIVQHVSIDQIPIDEGAVLAPQIRNNPCVAKTLDQAVLSRQKNIPHRQIHLRRPSNDDWPDQLTPIDLLRLAVSHNDERHGNPILCADKVRYHEYRRRAGENFIVAWAPRRRHDGDFPRDEVSRKDTS